MSNKKIRAKNSSGATLGAPPADLTGLPVLAGAYWPLMISTPWASNRLVLGRHTILVLS